MSSPWLLLLTLAACAGPPCPDCDGILEPLVELGDTDGDGALPGEPFVSPRLADGRFIVVVPWGPTAELPRLFDSTGRFLQLLGRLGGGPNEYRWPEFVYRVGDDAWIDDRDHVAILPPASDSATKLPWVHRLLSFLALPDSTFVLTTGVMSPGRTIRHVDRSGNLLLAFGDSVAQVGREPQWAVLAADGAGGLWSAPPLGRLELQHWVRPGVAGQRLDLSRDWFPKEREYRYPSPETPPQPILVGMWTDGKGAIWIVSRVADPEWPKGLGPETRGEGGVTYHPVEQMDLAYDTVIEQVDPSRGEPLAHFRVGIAATQVVEPWVIASAAQDGDGWYRARLWSVRPPPRRQ